METQKQVFISVNVPVAVNNMKGFGVVTERKQVVPLHCSRATEYFTVLLTMRKYLNLYVKVSIDLFGLNQIWSFLTDFRESPQHQFHENSCFQASAAK
jgi:hypothetical protein